MPTKIRSNLVESSQQMCTYSHDLTYLICVLSILAHSCCMKFNGASKLMALRYTTNATNIAEYFLQLIGFYLVTYFLHHCVFNPEVKNWQNQSTPFNWTDRYSSIMITRLVVQLITNQLKSDNFMELPKCGLLRIRWRCFFPGALIKFVIPNL